MAKSCALVRLSKNSVIFKVTYVVLLVTGMREGVKGKVDGP
jgi:hypothetical protein